MKAILKPSYAHSDIGPCRQNSDHGNNLKPPIYAVLTAIYKTHNVTGDMTSHVTKVNKVPGPAETNTISNVEHVLKHGIGLLKKDDGLRLHFLKLYIVSLATPITQRP